jgi:hypothetical protein
MTNFYTTGDMGGGTPQRPFCLEDINFPRLTPYISHI